MSFLIIFVGYVLHCYSFAELCSFIRYIEKECLHSYSIFLLLNFYMKKLVANFNLQKMYKHINEQSSIIMSYRLIRNLYYSSSLKKNEAQAHMHCVW
jgi:hypothetical protein